MTDGDTFNGYTITGLGYAKVARLFYDAQVNRLTSTSNYPALYNALISACTGLGYSASDCQRVRNALDAVEMYIEPCKVPYYTISGYVRDSSGNPVSGVTITFSNNLGSTTTDASGYYNRKVYNGWSGNVTPSKSGNTFTPLNRGYANAASNMSDQNYTIVNACASYNISPTTKSYDGGGGTGSVIASSGCTWTAKSNATWITITSSASGSGNGSVSYSVASNTGTSSRTGTITIAGKDLVVSQTPCTYGISPRSNSFTSTGGNGSISLTTSSAGCNWTATASDNWITITSVKSGVGNSTISYSVTQNTGNARTGTITIVRQVFTISQDGPIPCTSYSIFPQSQNVDGGGGSGSVSVTASTGCNWNASNNAPSWITITSPTNGSGNGTVSYSVAPNTTTGTRTGTLTIAGKTFTITQTPCTFGIAPTGKSFTYTGGNDAISVTASSAGCNWTAVSSDNSWIIITSGSIGIGNGTVSYSITPNTTTATRTGTITVVRQTFTITQTGISCTYSISPSGQSYPESTGGTGVVTVTAPNSCSWTAVSNASWITIGTGSPGNGNGTVSYSLTNNPGPGSRTGTITIAGQTFTITQAAPCSYSLSSTSQTFAYIGGIGSVNVIAATGCAWNAVSSNSDWLTITSGSRGSGNGTISYSVTQNTGTASRTGTLSVSNNQTFTVTQDFNNPTADLFLQNETVTTTLNYTFTNSIWAGREVTTQKPYGDYVIQSGGNVTLNSKTIYLKPGFKATAQ